MPSCPAVVFASVKTSPSSTEAGSSSYPVGTPLDPAPGKVTVTLPGVSVAATVPPETVPVPTPAAPTNDQLRARKVSVTVPVAANRPVSQYRNRQWPLLSAMQSNGEVLARSRQLGARPASRVTVPSPLPARVNSGVPSKIDARSMVRPVGGSNDKSIQLRSLRSLTSIDPPAPGSLIVPLAPTTVKVSDVAALPAPVVVPASVVMSAFLNAPAAKSRVTSPCGMTVVPREYRNRVVPVIRSAAVMRSRSVEPAGRSDIFATTTFVGVVSPGAVYW